MARLLPHCSERHNILIKAQSCRGINARHGILERFWRWGWVRGLQLVSSASVQQRNPGVRRVGTVD